MTNITESPVELLAGTEKELQILRWRLEQLGGLGFALEDAAQLAMGNADLAQARKLIGAGCPHAVALRILA